MKRNEERGEVLTRGEAIYLRSLRETLEATHRGEYVAIDVDTERYVIDLDRLQAIEKAHEEFGDKLIYVVQIGTLEEPSVNYRESEHVAWLLS